MALSTADEYRASLRDGRTLWYRGRRVPDILEEPDLRVAVDHAALDYEIGHDPLYRDLAVAKDSDTDSEYSAYYAIPRSSEDVVEAVRLCRLNLALAGIAPAFRVECADFLRMTPPEELNPVQRTMQLALFEHEAGEFVGWRHGVA